MSNIIEELREIAKDLSDYIDISFVPSKIHEAADEIEKLREEKRAMQGALRAIMAHTSSAHPMSYMADLWRIARAALGEKE
jgi:hypothetical protein